MKQDFKSRVALAATVFMTVSGKCGVMALLLAGWISCGQEEPDSGEKPYLVAEIENLQTQLYVFKPNASDEDIRSMWFPPKQEGVIFHCLSVPSFKNPELSAGIRFGYVDDENRTIICEVSNLPEDALQWGINVYWGKQADPIVMRANIRMSGTVRLYSKETENGVERFGTLELTSIAKDDAKKTLDLGMYTETFYNAGTFGINVVDEEKLIIVNYHFLVVFDEKTQEYVTVRDDSRGIAGSTEFHYRILDDALYLKFIDSSGKVSEHEDYFYFHIIDDSKIEIENLNGTIATFPWTLVVMTFEK